MQDKSYSFQIRRLLDLLDEQIYSSFSEQEQSHSISSFISWKAIHQFFTSENVFLSTLSLYHQTIISETKPNGNFKMSPLVVSCDINADGVEIEHITSALKSYLFHKGNSIVENSYIEEVFTNALSKYNMKSKVLYSIMSKETQYKTSPEELKELLNINYSNAMLKSRVLLPVEKTIYNLYQEYLLPFYFTFQTERSVIGRGSKTNGVTINIINHLDLLRLKRKRPIYMDFIMSQLTKLFPFDYPFLEEDIKKLDNKTVEDIYNMIRNIESDQDYHKIDTSTLIKYKLQQDYKVTILNYK